MIVIAILILLGIVAIGVSCIMNEQERGYEIETIKQYNYFILKQEDKYGVIDKKGNKIIEPQYSDIKIPNPEKAVFVCYEGENTKVFNERKEEILTEYQAVQPIRLKNISSDLMYEKSILVYQKEGKYGFINLEGEEITKPIYDEIDSLPYKEGSFVVKEQDKFGVVNMKGKELVKIEYDEIKLDEYYDEEKQYEYAGYIVLRKTEEGYRYGYLNHNGKEILGTEYNEILRVTGIHDQQNAYLICAKNGQYGLKKNEQTIIENQYQSIQYDETLSLIHI